MILEKEKLEFVNKIMEKIKNAQNNAISKLNKELICLYWDIGKSLYCNEKYGKSIIPLLSEKLQIEFPGIKGFSKRNLGYMYQFYKEYNSFNDLKDIFYNIGWSHNITIMQKCKDTQMRKFYILATKKFGWTNKVLIHQIENKTFEKFLLNQTNYDENLPEEIKKQVALAVKDQYLFDFLKLSENHSEKQLEGALLKNMPKFLSEMGNQFFFVGNQYKLEVGEEEFFIDLLLFHRELNAFVAIELKVGKFKPEYKGKMEFYLAVLNDKLKKPEENDSIGIIICKEKDRTVVEYSLNTSKMPIGIASYETTPKLPKNYENILPNKEEIIEKVDILFPDDE